MQGGPNEKAASRRPNFSLQYYIGAGHCQISRRGKVIHWLRDKPSAILIQLSTAN
jgi:hypothetical protein